MAVAGPNYAGAGASQAGVGTAAWSTPANIVSDNSTYASANPVAGGQSQYLVASSFGFAIPTGSTIDGIVVEIDRKRAATTTFVDNQIRIVKGGSIGATDKASATGYTTSEVVATYGSSTDLWGETWTAEDINASNFGAAISVKNTGVKFTANAFVDFIRITVYYTEGASAPAYVSRMTLMGVG